MAQSNIPNVLMEDVELIWINFSGRPDKYNAKGGARYFSVKLSDKKAKAMERDGWNVKWPKPNPSDDEEGEEREPTLNVAVRFDNKPPLIFMMTSNNPTPPAMKEDMVGMLDSVDIKHVDLIINASRYKRNDDTYGIKAYCKALYVTIEEDPFAIKYGINNAQRPSTQMSSDLDD